MLSVTKINIYLNFLVTDRCMRAFQSAYGEDIGCIYIENIILYRKNFHFILKIFDI